MKITITVTSDDDKPLALTTASFATEGDEAPKSDADWVVLCQGLADFLKERNFTPEDMKRIFAESVKTTYLNMTETSDQMMLYFIPSHPTLSSPEKLIECLEDVGFNVIDYAVSRGKRCYITLMLCLRKDEKANFIQHVLFYFASARNALKRIWHDLIYK